MQKVLILLIHLYQNIISAALPFNHCRFYPSCSEYSIEAIEKLGVINGSWLAAKRILRCMPYSSKSGYDPVP